MNEFDAIQKAYGSVIKAGYDGIEIFMMNVGNADCFLVIRYYAGGTKDVILIDGGKTSDAENIVQRIKDLGITHVDYVVNTHPHDDHAAGLVEILKETSLTFGSLWMHASWTRIDAAAIREVLGRNSAKWVLEAFEKSLATQMEVFTACISRKIPVYEPFAGSIIGPFKVIGPTPAFYTTCMAKFSDLTSITQWNDYLSNCSLRQLIATLQKEAVQTEEELGGVTSPENESSVIMTLDYGELRFLFCGDAGCDAFGDINNRRQISDLQNVHWMHAPHHGSRRNLWKEAIAYFKPKTVFISSEGSRKHPSTKLVNAFNKNGTKVYSSHYSSGNRFVWLRYPVGTVPPRNVIPATALYEAV